MQRTLVAVELKNTASLTRRTQVKAEYRIVAALSLRHNYVYAVVMSLAMHYPSPIPLTPAEMEGRTDTHQWISRVLGEHLNLRPIQSRLAFGIDDVTIVAFRGGRDEVQWGCVDKRAKDDTRAYYTVDDGHGNQFLLRMCLTMISSGRGEKCRIIGTVSGLTEEQLGGKKMKVLKIKGATPAAGQDPAAATDTSPNNYGVLILQTGTADYENSKYVYDSELEPMIESVRKQDPTYQADSPRPIDTALVQEDGAHGPLKYSDSRSTLERYDTRRIRVLKTGASCSMLQAAVRYFRRVAPKYSQLLLTCVRVCACVCVCECVWPLMNL